MNITAFFKCQCINYFTIDTKISHYVKSSAITQSIVVSRANRLARIHNLTTTHIWPRVWCKYRKYIKIHILVYVCMCVWVCFVWLIRLSWQLLSRRLLVSFQRQILWKCIVFLSSKIKLTKNINTLLYYTRRNRYILFMHNQDILAP